MEKLSANNMLVKRLNRNKVFRFIIRKEQLSRPEISEGLGISMPTVLSLINELFEMGLIKEVGKFESTGGRRAAALSPVYDARFAVGLDITAHHISMVLTDLSARVLKHDRIKLPFALSPQYVAEISALLEAFIESTRINKEKILGVGISIPGIVDLKNENILVSHALKISNVAFEHFSRQIPYHCRFVNDANASAYAEIFDSDFSLNAILLSLSDTVGGAIIHKTGAMDMNDSVGSYILLGDNWKSGEIGHMTLYPYGRPCYCGKSGCFDAYCSAKILSQHTDGDLKAFFKQLDEGNAALAAIWEEYLDNLAIMVNNIRMMHDCDIIIGGYIGSYIRPYFPALAEKVKALNTFHENVGFIKPCNYHVEASAFGAALLFVENFIKSV